MLHTVPENLQIESKAKKKGREREEKGIKREREGERGREREGGRERETHIDEAC